MSGPPKTCDVACPHCGAMAVAVIPTDAEVVDEEADGDGKVRVNCRSCDEQFNVHFQVDQ